MPTSSTSGASGFHEELAPAHDLLVIDPDIELPADNVDVCRRVPVRPGVRAVGIPERDVYSRVFLVLQDLADYVLQVNVGADRKLAHAVAIGVGVGVLPEIILQFAIVGVGLGQAVAFYADNDRRVAQAAEFGTEVVTHHAINDERAVHFSRGGKDFPAGQITPFLGKDDSAGLQPPVIRIQIGREVGSRCRAGVNPGRLTHHLHHFLAQPVHALEIRAHTLEHDLAIDVHHVRVPDLASVDYVGHLDARAQLVSLCLNGKDRDVALFKVIENFAGKIDEGAAGKLLQNPCLIWCAQLFEFRHHGGCNFERSFVGNHTNALGRLNPEADIHRIASPGGKLRVKGNVVEFDMVGTYRSAH